MNTIYLLSNQGNLTVEKFHFCTWDVRDENTFVEAGVCIKKDNNTLENIDFFLALPFLTDQTTAESLHTHLLFMANYIDYSDYDFRDEDQVESYCWCYRDLFEMKTKESQEIVNSQLIEFLDEWRQDAPSRYRKAKDDICYCGQKR